MASLQEPGLVRIYRQVPSGSKQQIFQMRVEQSAPAGGAPDGNPAVVSTPEKLLNVDSPIVFNNDDIVLVTFEPDGADSLDASDCIWSVPIVIPSGSSSLGRAQFANPTFADQALVASREVVIAGYKVTEGKLRISGKWYLDIQDDTA